MTASSTKENAAHRAPRAQRIAANAVRLCFGAVFVVNVMCAVQFIAWPDAFTAAYELSGVPGRAALQGIGIAFLMWNVTYPAVIVSPARSVGLGLVVLVQQLVGLLGESMILQTLPAGHEQLASSITRFIIFDGAGLVIMAAAFAWFLAVRGWSRMRKR